MFGHRLTSTVRTLIRRARETQLPFLAASLAYYMLVSLFPLGLLAFVLASAIGGEAFADVVIDTVSSFLSPSGTALLDEALQAGAGRGGATVAGILLLLWSSLRMFRGLDVAFTIAYGRADPGSFPEQVLDATVALLGIGIAVVSLIAINAVLAASGLALSGIGGTLLLVVTLFVGFYPFYYLFPDVDVGYREAVPGTLFAAVGWTALGATFTIYAANAGSFAIYGAVGAILLLLAWFYLAGGILLFGALLNAELSGFEPLPPGVVADAGGGEDGADRQRQKVAARTSKTMSDAGTPSEDEEVASEESTGAVESPAGDAVSPGGPSPSGVPDAAGVDDGATVADEAEVDRLREELAAVREELDEKTLPRDELEGDLRRYVRARVRRGHAHGWGPYLVLLYGTAMTLGAFYFLDGLTAIFAMFVVWLSTLGLYVLMLLVGLAANAVSLPGRAIDRVRDFRR